MRTVNVQASHGLSSLPNMFWKTKSGRRIFRPTLNIRELVHVLQSKVTLKGFGTQEDRAHDANLKDGKKRAPSPSGNQPSPKRAKFMDTDTPELASGVDGIDAVAEPSPPSSLAVLLNECLDSWPDVEHAYPSPSSAASKHRHRGYQRSALSYVRIDTIRYTMDTATGGALQRPPHWVEEEANLHHVMEAFSRGCSEPRTVGLGFVGMHSFEGRVYVASKSAEWLLLLPLESDGVVESADVLCSFLIAKQEGQIDMSATLSITIYPPGACADGELPFSIQVETCCEFLYPAILEDPAHRHKGKTAAARVREALRRVHNYLYTPEADLGTVDIPFFYSTLKPAPFTDVEDRVQPQALVPKLLPFQRRSVAWLLAREGVTLNPQGEIIPLQVSSSDAEGDTQTQNPLLFFWKKVVEGNESWYFNCLSGETADAPPRVEDVLGGILAEEPGLGKTLETISLILLHPAPHRNPSITRWDPVAALDVKQVKTTLIVTPMTLASQWVDELAKHAPTLKVLIYDGWSKLGVPLTEGAATKLRDELTKKQARPARGKDSRSQKSASVEFAGKQVTEPADIMDWAHYVNTFDVVITTYATLRVEVNVARPAPVRPRRGDVVYANVERPRSPLVSVEWMRVVMDEVQMAGGGKTEDMVGMIPRLSSLAVSGTPARGQVSDLLHVIRFLRIENVIGPQKNWTTLLQPNLAREFAAFFEYYGIRTTKALVKHELQIPTQTRYLVPINLGRVERHVYDQALEEALLHLGLDARGVAASAGWDIDGALLRVRLRHLRGICTHPQVGELQLGAAGGNSKKALKTMNEVLKASQSLVMHILVNALVTQAQLLQMEQGLNRYQRVLPILKNAEKEGKLLRDEINAALAAATAKGATANADGDANADEDADGGESSAGSDDANGGSAVQKGTLRNRLREVTIALHRAYFVMGDVYHVLGRKEEEDAAYAQAEDLRKSILANAEKDAQNAMAQLAKDAALQGITEDALLVETPFLHQGAEMKAIEDKRKARRNENRVARGLAPVSDSEDENEEAKDVDGSDSDASNPEVKPKKKKKKPVPMSALIEQANFIVSEVLNEQANLMWEWRTRLTELLTRKIAPQGSGEDEADGQEYQRSLDDQGAAESYMQAYSILIADHREAMIKERTILAAHDAKEKRKRHTRAALNAAETVAPEIRDLDDENQALYVELSYQRKDLVEQLDGRAIKSILTDLKARMTKIKSEKDPEKILLRDAIADIHVLLNERAPLLEKLEVDLSSFRKVFNLRVVYFAQLQEISDSVAQPTIETTLPDTIHAIEVELQELDAKINTSKARHRYLAHLAEAGNVQPEDDDDDDRACILCRHDFIRGFITPCAHIFCEPCLQAWLARKEGKTCPVCRVPVAADQMQRFTVDEADKPPERNPKNDAVVPKSRRVIEYNAIDASLFEQIQSVSSYGDFGSKIQTLVKHLLYLQQTEPGTKSICFSSWPDSLHILQRALNDNDIPSIRIDQKRGHNSAAKRFRSDPEILVLLLHGERENAGLNITCASRVFLLESVVHHGFEIQVAGPFEAIARIDRMGQTRSTEVFCYYAEDTVERNILDLAARQGLSLYTKDNAAGTLNTAKFGATPQNATPAEAKAKKETIKGDFIGKIDDMLAVLFPHMYEDVEYLVDQDGDAQMVESRPASSAPEAGPSTGATTRGRRRPPPQVNAVAGPSRTR
ncbi:hypothetical protein EYR38_010373 [Pleurotus pulmonarius]|nr:hypothetical protein EYR38_010373 [Pleurotus pulmonarius]